MAKQKALEQLRTEKERAETQLAQKQHKLERFENRGKHYEKGERRGAPTAFAIWTERLRALPRRSKEKHPYRFDTNAKLFYARCPNSGGHRCPLLAAY